VRKKAEREKLQVGLLVASLLMLMLCCLSLPLLSASSDAAPTI
jgi:hypothetical protein